jgi:hypothetical protein
MIPSPWLRTMQSQGEGGEASEAEIGKDEVRVFATEEEIVVEKRPVAKEEVR